MQKLLTINDAFAWRVGSNPYLQRLYRYLAHEAHALVLCALILPAVAGGLLITVGGLVSTLVNTMAGTNPHPLSYESFGRENAEHPLGIACGALIVLALAWLMPGGFGWDLLALSAYAAFMLWLIQAMRQYEPAPVKTRV